jgi:hypothetical protein
MWPSTTGSNVVVERAARFALGDDASLRCVQSAADPHAVLRGLRRPAAGRTVSPDRTAFDKAALRPPSFVIMYRCSAQPLLCLRRALRRFAVVCALGRIAIETALPTP